MVLYLVIYSNIIGVRIMRQFRYIITVLLLALFLTGCFDSPEDEGYSNQVFSYTVDQVDEAGVLLEAPADNMFIPFERVSELYQNMMNCVSPDVVVPAPTVWFRSFDSLGLGGNRGAYLYATAHVLINTDQDEIVERNYISDEETVEHEFVHHLLYMTGQDASHASPYFAKCGATGVNVCNGEPCR